VEPEIIGAVCMANRIRNLFTVMADRASGDKPDNQIRKESTNICYFSIIYLDYCSVAQESRVPARPQQALLAAMCVPPIRPSPQPVSRLLDALEKGAEAAARKISQARHQRAALQAAILRWADTIIDCPLEEVSRPKLLEIRSRITRRIARERCRSRSGSPDYDLNRHIALHQTLGAIAEAIEAKE
jgi:hypothetical protein